MQSIENSFDSFVAAQVVEKVSKSGIFSNKRLLIIKDCYLYYFTEVPKDFVGSIMPDIIDQISGFPKCSIDVQLLYSIKISQNSSMLIITFKEGDMIEREQLRKSVEVRAYIPQKRSASQLQQWKFIFQSELACKKWFNALKSIKQSLRKHHGLDKFLSNFDPKRQSLMKYETPENMISISQQEINEYGSSMWNNQTEQFSQRHVQFPQDFIHKLDRISKNETMSTHGQIDLQTKILSQQEEIKRLQQMLADKKKAIETIDLQQQINKKVQYSVQTDPASQNHSQSVLPKSLGSESTSLLQDCLQPQEDYYIQLLNIKKLPCKQRISKQIKVLRYIRQKGEQLKIAIKAIIDNQKPKESITRSRLGFHLEIVCQRGHTVCLDTGQTLVYSNKDHSRLKNIFKTYSYLQDRLERSAKYLWPPLCYLFQYKGYTILAQLQQDLQQCYNHKFHTIINKEVGHICWSVYRLKNKPHEIYILKLKQPYIPKHYQRIIFPNSWSLSFIDDCRRQRISISSTYLEQTIKQLKLNPNEFQTLRQYTQFYQFITLMRYIKKLYRSTQPFLNTKLHFFNILLMNPQILDPSIPKALINKGRFVIYLKYTFGLLLPNKSVNEDNFIINCQPIMRMYAYSYFTIFHFRRNYKNFMHKNEQQKLELCLQLQRLIQSVFKSKIMQLQILISLGEFNRALELINTTSISYYDDNLITYYLLCLQCYETLQMQDKAISLLNTIVKYVEDIFGRPHALFSMFQLHSAQCLAKYGHAQQSIYLYSHLIPQDRQHLVESISKSCSAVTTLNESEQVKQFIKFLKDSLVGDQIHNACLQVALGKLRQWQGNNTESYKAYKLAFKSFLNHKRTSDLIQLSPLLLRNCPHHFQKQQLHKTIITYLSKCSNKPIMSVYYTNLIVHMLNDMKLNHQQLKVVRQNLCQDIDKKVPTWNQVQQYVNNLLIKCSPCEFSIDIAIIKQSLK